jgi:hypothetical protein
MYTRGKEGRRATWCKRGREKWKGNSGQDAMQSINFYCRVTRATDSITIKSLRINRRLIYRNIPNNHKEIFSLPQDYCLQSSIFAVKNNTNLLYLT